MKEQVKKTNASTKNTSPAKSKQTSIKAKKENKQKIALPKF